jgi:hypothetical protein
MRAAFGGEMVDPLHVTADRVSTEATGALVRAVRESVDRLRPAPIVVDGVFLLPSMQRGPRIAKLNVVAHDALERDVAALRAAMRECGLPSLHAEERAMNVSVLQRVSGSSSVDTTTWGLPLELFVGDVVLVSRIRGPSSYEILDTATIPATG